MAKPNWVLFPDYRVTNPYQTLLAWELRQAFDVVAGTIETALAAGASGSPAVFHLHWQEVVYKGARDERAAEAAVAGFGAAIDRFRAAGGFFIWTAHNLAPHENAFPAAEALLRAILTRAADLVHAHNATTARELTAQGFLADRIVVFPLPHMIDFYPDDVTDAQARRYFGIGSNVVVFAFFGLIRGYKGVETLIEAFRALQAQRRDVALIIAGKQADPGTARVYVANGIYRIPRFVEDSTVQYIMRAARFAVLPYSRITTSSAVMLAMGYGRPVIVPDLPPFLDLVADRREALVYAAGRADSLARVMGEACAVSPADYLEMSRRARDLARGLTFRDLAALLLSRVTAGRA